MATRCLEDFFSTSKFFKIIGPDPLANLIIPAEFMKRHGRNLKKRVFLKVPNKGVWWEVDLTHSNGKTMLQRGWREFSERYSLGYGHFLVFEYRGNSQFNVVIFDSRSATEVDYFEAEGSGTESDDSLVVLEHLPSRKRKSKVFQDSDTRVPKTRMKPEESSSTIPKNQHILTMETSMAYQRALDFATGPNFGSPFFISLMRPTYIAARLQVPRSFIEEMMFACGSSSDLILGIKNDEKKVWPVKLHCYPRGAKLSSGWKDFVKDNVLKVGDACIFQVVNNSHWNVVIFKS